MSLNNAAWLHTHSKSRSSRFGGENGGTDEGKRERGACLKGREALEESAPKCSKIKDIVTSKGFGRAR